MFTRTFPAEVLCAEPLRRTDLPRLAVARAVYAKMLKNLWNARQGNVLSVLYRVHGGK